MAETVVVKLRLSEELYDQYAERAQKFGRTVEQELLLRLKTCRDHTDIAPLYFSDAQKKELQTAIGHLISTPEHALDQLKRLLSLKVGSVEVPLSDRLQVRLKTRVFRGQTVETVIKKEVTESLERYVGMR